MRTILSSMLGKKKSLRIKPQDLDKNLTLSFTFTVRKVKSDSPTKDKAEVLKMSSAKKKELEEYVKDDFLKSQLLDEYNASTGSEMVAKAASTTFEENKIILTVEFSGNSPNSMKELKSILVGIEKGIDNYEVDGFCLNNRIVVNNVNSSRGGFKKMRKTRRIKK